MVIVQQEGIFADSFKLVYIHTTGDCTPFDRTRMYFQRHLHCHVD